VRPTKRARHAILLCLICIVTALAAHSSSLAISSTNQSAKKKKPLEASSDQFVWRVDLHPLGYPTDDPMLQRRRGIQDFDTLDFVSDTVEVATFLTQEAPHDLRRRDTSNPPPYTLHAVFFDAASGNVVKTLEWPVEDANAGIFPGYDGSFLFFSTERIVLYSADWQPVKELPLPQLQEPHASLLGIAESPTGKTLLIYFRNEKSRACIRIDTGQLEGDEKACAIGLPFTVSDEGMAVRNERAANNEINSGPQFDTQAKVAASLDYSILIRAKAGESQYNLCEEHDPSAGYCRTPQFIANGWIALFGIDLALSDLTGRATVILKYMPSMNSPWIDPNGRPLRPSADGQRFALALTESLFQVFGTPGNLYASGSELPAEYPDRIQVFDVRMNNWIYTLHNKGKQFPKIWGLALSPSGGQLAVDSGGVIQTYALPGADVTQSH